MNANHKRKGRGNSATRHIRQKNSFGSTGSNSLDWRRDNTKNSGVNETNSYGYNNHYLTSAFCMLVGLKVKIQKTDGSVYEGILETVSNKLEFHLAYVSRKNSNGTTSLKDNPTDKAMFQFCDIVYCRATDVDLNFAKKDALLTDSVISGSNGPTVRPLIPWQSGDADFHVDLEDDVNGTCGLEFEEMIRINEEKHGVKSSFDSSMSNYMTPLVKRDDEEYKEQERVAEQLAREIQSETQFKDNDAIDSGIGEEDMFSSVSRTAADSNTLSSTAINNNNNIVSNDGFTMPKHNRNKVPRLLRNNKSQEANQNINYGNRNQESNQYNNRNNILHKAQNGNPGRNNSYHQPSSQVNDNAQSKNTIGMPHQQTQPQAQQQPTVQQTTQNEIQLQPASKPTMSYSAAAMKKGSNKIVSPTQTQNIAQVPQQQTPPPQQPPSQQLPQQQNSQPVMPQQISPQKKSIDNTPTLSVLSSPPTPQLNQESINAAKKQVIQNLQKENNKNYSVMTQTSLHNQPRDTAMQTTPQINSAGQLSSPQTVGATTEGSNQPFQTSSISRPLQSSSEVLSPEKVPQHTEPLNHDRPLHNGDKHDVIPLDQKKETLSSPLNKFGKVHQISPDGEKKPTVTGLREFAKTFQLGTKNNTPEPVKTKDDRAKHVDVSASPSITSVITGPTETKVAVTTAVDVKSIVTTAHSIPTVSSTPTVASNNPHNTNSIASPTETLTAPTSTNETLSKKSTLNPTAKEFTLNPAAKEFNPTTVTKPVLTKQISYASPEIVPMNEYNTNRYYQAAPMISQQPHADMMQSQSIHQVVNPIMRYPSTVFTIPAGEYPNQNSGPQVIAAAPHTGGFISQGMHTQQPYFLLANGTSATVYPQVLATNQQYIQMQPGGQQGMVRYVTPHAACQAVQTLSNRIQSNYQDVPSNYFITVNQQGVMPHHAASGNNYSAPPSHLQHQQQPQQQQQQQQHQQQPQQQQAYVVNPANFSQITPAINRSQGGTVSYHPTTTLHSAAAHQQQSFMMPHHPMQPTQQYLQGQPLLPSYATTN